jgi:hypothetical protein
MALYITEMTSAMLTLSQIIIMEGNSDSSGVFSEMIGTMCGLLFIYSD